MSAEYDVNNPPSLNEKVLKDKRKKLRETFQRILKLYEKEDREQWIELKKFEQEYEKKRNMMIQYFGNYFQFFILSFITRLVFKLRPNLAKAVRPLFGFTPRKWQEIYP